MNAMAKVKTDKYVSKKAALIERTSTALICTPEEAASLLSITRQQSVRINTLKADKTELFQRVFALEPSATQSPLMDTGVYVEGSLKYVRDSDLVTDGQVYIQNAASWLPVLALEPKAGETILDMCAAPGGKTSHIAAVSNNQAFITANDNSRPRLHKLQGNLSRLGVENVEYLLHDATKLAMKLGTEQFDKILLDAPCSGEGMMTLESRKDFESWSVAHIKRLQQLQKRLLSQAWQLLRPGGTLVYSTCTMAPEENEAVVDYLLRHNDDVSVERLDALARHLENIVDPVLEWNARQYDPRISAALRLKPSKQVEAFFVIKLTKQQ